MLFQDALKSTVDRIKNMNYEQLESRLEEAENKDFVVLLNFLLQNQIPDSDETSSKFKEGDLVFVLHKRLGILLTTVTAVDSDAYEFPVHTDLNCYTKEGKDREENTIPSLYLATPENYKKFCNFFGKELVPELPPEPTPSDIMFKLMKQGSHIAKTSNVSIEAARLSHSLILIVGVKSGQWLTSCGVLQEFCVPYNSRGVEIKNYTSNA